ncbi:hypothetical protein EVAR_30905_1 [Eumeta japonica]|uniref:Uncharacterized protein n=1 Tax=Eumeta variegata TaxID=151549 RepID=A0A4C1V4W6_EUMVA|nr:hypothetical protein EVAR_30905_1 [Eumeta japonica]
MNDSVKKRNMKVYIGKIKVMVFERGVCMTECDILIKGEKVEPVKEFVYLGSLFAYDGKHNTDIERRVNGALLAIMNSKSDSREARLAVHNGVLNPIYMYGSESWMWQKKHESGINAVAMPPLRSVWCLIKINIKTVMLESGMA